MKSDETLGFLKAEVRATSVERQLIPTAQAAPCRRTTRIAKIGPGHPRPMFCVQAKS